MKNGNGALLREVELARVRTSPQRQKGPAVSRKMWQGKEMLYLGFPGGVCRGVGGVSGSMARSPRCGVTISEACSRARPRLVGFGRGTPAVGIRTDTKQHQGSLFL